MCNYLVVNKMYSHITEKLFVKLRFDFSQDLSLFNHMANLIITYYSIHSPVRVFVKLFPFTFQFSLFQVAKSYST